MVVAYKVLNDVSLYEMGSIPHLLIDPGFCPSHECMVMFLRI